MEFNIGGKVKKRDTDEFRTQCELQKKNQKKEKLHFILYVMCLLLHINLLVIIYRSTGNESDSLPCNDVGSSEHTRVSIERGDVGLRW